jgi:hypothetical protein
LPDERLERDRGFESISLQRRVCEPSVPSPKVAWTSSFSMRECQKPLRF